MTELAVVKTEYKWEVIGSSLHPTVALCNHSCDPNTFRSNTISKLILHQKYFRFNMNQTSLLIASRHVSAGEEVTMSYEAVDWRTVALQQREYRLLKHYMFQVSWGWWTPGHVTTVCVSYY